MHVTRIGKFNHLVVKIYNNSDKGSNHLFCDKEAEIQEFMNQEALKGPEYAGFFLLMKDLNYLLNSMLKSKGTDPGQQLYMIYCREYPDDDTKVNVWKVWNNKQVVKGTEYFIRKKPWYKVIRSIITPEEYKVILQCEVCGDLQEVNVEEIQNICPTCQLK